jgi:hypothetical protein
MINERDPHPHQPGSDEADPEKTSTPAGVTRDLEQRAEDSGASEGSDGSTSE